MKVTLLIAMCTLVVLLQGMQAQAGESMLQCCELEQVVQKVVKF